jgi:hypothetical protein
MKRRIFWGGLVLGTALRIALSPSPGTNDVTLWKEWSYAATRIGVARMYGVGGQPPDPAVVAYKGRWKDANYPPLALYAMALSGHLHAALDPEFRDGALLTVLVKLPTLLAEVGLTALILAAVRRVGGGAAEAQGAALGYWLNPAALLNAAALGYIDPLVALPALGALVAASVGWPAVAGALLAAGLLTKPQAIFVAPAIAVAFWQSPRRLGDVARAAGAGLVTAVAGLAAVVAAGGGGNLLRAMAALTHHDVLSGDAVNFWWLVTWVRRAVTSAGEVGLVEAWTRPVRILRISRLVEEGFPNPRPFALAALLLAVGWGLWRARRSRDVAIHCALTAFVVQAYFVLGVGVHENHQFLVLPFLAVAAAVMPRFRGLFVVLSAIVALNLNMFYGFGMGVGYALPRGLTGLDGTVLLAVANVAALVWFGRAFGREAKTLSRIA